MNKKEAHDSQKNSLKKELKSQLMAKIAIVFISTLVSLVLVEIFLRAISLDVTPPDSSIKDNKLIVRPNPDFPDHDQRGFRNFSVPETAVIITLGDSQTYGNWVNKNETWPYRLEQRTNLASYNMAYGGYGPVQGLVLLPEALEFKPKLIIYGLYIGNDIFDSYAFVYKDRLYPELISRDENLTKTLADIDSKDPLYSNVEEWSYRKLLESPAKYSKIYSLVIRLIKISFYNASAKPWREITIEGSEGKFVVEGDKEGKIFVPDDHLTAVNLDDLRIKEGLKVTLEAIEMMKSKTEEGGAKFLVLIIPTKYTVYRDLIRENNIDSSNFESLIKYEEQAKEALIPELEKRQINYLDTYEDLVRMTSEGKPTYNESVDRHLNPLGHELIAELLEKKIKEENFTDFPLFPTN